MLDGQGRGIDYLRLSVTDRCDLRCVYCMPPEGAAWVPHGEILTYEEILRVCRVLAGLGVRTIRLTGGEPLVRRGVDGLAGALRQLPGVERVVMTTNGQRLAELAGALKQAGLEGVNLSLDTLDREKYARLTRGGELEKTLRGLDRALEVGLKVKLNCVPLSGAEEDAAALAALARDRGVDLRFIELMPLGEGARLAGLSSDQVRAVLTARYGPLTPWEGTEGDGPAVYETLEGFPGKIGFISPMTRSFCARCSRVRLTAQGFLKLCLYESAGLDLRALLRSGAGDRELRERAAAAIRQKPAAHRFGQGPGDGRKMFQIGG